MKCVLKAPRIDYFVGVLSNRNGNAYTYDETTQATIKEIFECLHTITLVLPNDVYELWITAERGTLVDYGDYEELLAYGEVDSYSEFESLWQEEYPSERRYDTELLDTGITSVHKIGIAFRGKNAVVKKERE